MHLLNLEALIDFANRAKDEFAGYKIPMILSPERLTAGDYSLDALNWDSIPYGESEIEQVPDNQRGIYAFVIHEANKVHPPHGYILYIGIAGRNSNRPLRDRYRDYLNEKKVLKRARIARMIGTWHSVLHFYFAPVASTMSSEDLERLETQLNDAFLPPFSEGDLSAETRTMRRAYRL